MNWRSKLLSEFKELENYMDDAQTKLFSDKKKSLLSRDFEYEKCVLKNKCSILQEKIIQEMHQYE